MFEELHIINFPDPRLRKTSKPVESFDADLSALAQRMFELMREHKGVGLAAPQVGKNIRLFVMNPTGNPADDRVYVNPRLLDGTGEEEDDEGCLSLPDIRVTVLRAQTLRLEAYDLQGKPLIETETGYIARIWQHETDHLNGTLITDHMGPSAKIASRKKLRKLEDDYAKEHPQPPKPKKRK